MVKITLKWGREKFDNIELNEDEDFLDLKAKVYAATCVPIEKQKLIYKGSVLKVTIVFLQKVD
jgi:ubiquitin carboxyl-terminal hydrolase 14